MPPAATTTTRSICTAETEQGTHVFDIVGYSLHKGMGVENFLRSAVFSVGGYRWAIRFYPDGPPIPVAGINDRSVQHRHNIAVYLVLMSKGATARASCDLSLVDWGTGQPVSVHATTEPWLFKYGEVSMFFPQTAFMDRAELEASPYLADDRVTILCVVRVIKERRVSSAAGLGRLMSLSAMASCWRLKRMKMSLSELEEEEQPLGCTEQLHVFKSVP